MIGMKTWTRVGENLVRHQGGTIYLRLKVAGKIIRRSLETSDLPTARTKRDAEAKRIRKTATTTGKTQTTLAAILHTLEDECTADPRLKPSTRKYYTELYKILRETLPVTCHPRSWTAALARSWWHDIAQRYSTPRANNTLAHAKKLGSHIHDHYAVPDPTENLRRMIPRARQPFNPSREQMEAIIRQVRSRGISGSVEASAYVAVLAFSGCRMGEARGLLWEDVGEQWLTITGGPDGTKNGSMRRVPISESLRDALEAIRTPEATGPLFSCDSPRYALNVATKKLGLPHLRLHDLRHFFATWAIESGVDIPTASRWLGHKDGGTLLMKTYSHLRDQHSLDSAAKLR